MSTSNFAILALSCFKGAHLRKTREYVYGKPTCTTWAGGGTFQTLAWIANTEDDTLYQSERFGKSGIVSYEIPVPVASYEVVLHFAEVRNNKILDEHTHDPVLLSDRNCLGGSRSAC